MFALGEGIYRVAGSTPLSRIDEAFGVQLQDHAERTHEAHFETIAGLIAHEKGHVPKRGETHRVGGLHFSTLHTKSGVVRWFRVTAIEDAKT